MAFVSAGAAPRQDRTEEGAAGAPLESASKLFYLIASMDQTNNESLNGIREASQNLRTDIDSLKSLTASIKEVASGYEIR